MSLQNSRTSLYLNSSTPIKQTMEVVVNDEHERSIRRSDADFQRRITSFCPQSPYASEQEIKEHFQTCLKMYAENKINIKNAWNLRMIDYMRTVLISTFQINSTLQVAGTSLDVGTKIYVIRVDDVHSNSLKLASSMMRTNTQQPREDMEVDNTIESIERVAQRKNKKIRNLLTGPKTTVSKDVNNLLATVPKMLSVYFNISSEVNLTASNLLSNTLPLHFTGYKFMLLSDEKAWVNYGCKANVVFLRKYPIKIRKLSNINICPEFSDFEIDQWNIEDEQRLFLRENDESGVAYDKEGLPIPELDGTVHNIFEEDVETCDDRLNHFYELDVIKRCVANDYSYGNPVKVYGNKRISQAWAGPSHWKLKYIRQSKSQFTGENNANRRRKVRIPKAKPKPINFATNFSSVNKTKFCKKLLSQDSNNYYKCTLPEKFLVKDGLDRPLMSKPLYLHKVDKDILEDSIASVELNNNDNNNNYYDSFNSKENNASFLEEIQDCNENVPYGECLVDLPEMVPTTYIPHAHKSKTINMKKLKTAIWKTLVEDTNLQGDEDIYKKRIKVRKFFEVYNDLPKFLSKRAIEELSCPLAFVALLHLANDQNLKLTKIENKNDFTIAQCKSYLDATQY